MIGYTKKVIKELTQEETATRLERELNKAQNDLLDAINQQELIQVKLIEARAFVDMLTERVARLQNK